MSSPSLTEVLAAYGLTHRRRSPASQAHEILDETGDEMFVGTAHEVWAWVQTFDTLEWDELAAFGEGRLLPSEATSIVVKLHIEGRSRASLRDLFPEVYAAHFGPPPASGSQAHED